MVTVMGWGCYWRSVGGNQGCGGHPEMPKQSCIMKSYLAPNANSAPSFLSSPTMEAIIECQLYARDFSFKSLIR